MSILNGFLKSDLGGNMRNRMSFLLSCITGSCIAPKRDFTCLVD